MEEGKKAISSTWLAPGVENGRPSNEFRPFGPADRYRWQLPRPLAVSEAAVLPLLHATETTNEASDGVRRIS